MTKKDLSGFFLALTAFVLTATIALNASRVATRDRSFSAKSNPFAYPAMIMSVAEGSFRPITDSTFLLSTIAGCFLPFLVASYVAAVRSKTGTAVLVAMIGFGILLAGRAKGYMWRMPGLREAAVLELALATLGFFLGTLAARRSTRNRSPV